MIKMIYTKFYYDSNWFFCKLLKFTTEFEIYIFVVKRYLYLFFKLHIKTFHTNVEGIIKIGNSSK